MMMTMMMMLPAAAAATTDDAADDDDDDEEEASSPPSLSLSARTFSSKAKPRTRRAAAVRGRSGKNTSIPFCPFTDSFRGRR
uniref:Putative secreted protein n=1 Tax=Anopheles marajoara TaxID=58244 RepID=A0A2M4CBW2_9DIPT